MAVPTAASSPSFGFPWRLHSFSFVFAQHLVNMLVLTACFAFRLKMPD